MPKRTKSLESSTRKKIDLILNNLGWDTNEDSSKCNVFTERAKTTSQNKRFKGKKPDYVLYKYNSDSPIAIIETKRKGKSLNKALEQAIIYAKILSINIVIATDGTLFRTLHIKDNKELMSDGETLTELITERKLLKFVEEGSDISEATKEIKHTREELIRIFEWTNNLLRKEGLREGIERFTEFANILFLKLISEMEEERNKKKEERLLEDKFCWKSFSDLDAPRMLEYINGIVLPHLVNKYNHSGDVFKNKLGIKTSKTIKIIVDKLSNLKLINADSDVKGDAFEYFLKNSVTIGNDLGEYFTPRHIVRLMVNLVNPQFGDKVYDPTCGTGGFIIEAFRHIKNTCKLTKNNLKILKEETIWAREITNTSRIAKMNMILAGDGHTNIKQMDSLEVPIEKKFDVVLANIPYGQTTDWGDLYPVHSKMADCTFVQHILLSLANNGRAAIIVPEGFLFRGGSDQKTREYLLNNYNLLAVISLPCGVFLPYTAAKTNILILKDGSRTKSVWFYDMVNDGFELTTTRKPSGKSDIGDLISKWDDRFNISSDKCWLINLDVIKENDYNLTNSKYKSTKKYSSDYPIVKFSEIMKENKNIIQINNEEKYKRITIKLHGKGITLRDNVFGKVIKTKQQKITKKNQFIVAEIDAKVGGFGVISEEFKDAIVSSHYFLFDLDSKIVLPKFFDYLIRNGPYEELIKPYVKGTTNYASIRPQHVLKLQLPLPPIEVQRTIIENLSKKDEIIISIEKTLNIMKKDLITKIVPSKLEGKTLKLFEICKLIKAGGTPTRTVHKYFKGDIPWVKIGDLVDLGYVKDTKEKISKEAIIDSKLKLFKKKTVLISIFATIGAVSLLDIEACTNQAIVGIEVNEEMVLPEYLAYYLRSIRKELESLSRGIAQKNINLTILKSRDIFLPNLKVQQAIVNDINKKIETYNTLRRILFETREEHKNEIRDLFILLK